MAGKMDMMVLELSKLYRLKVNWVPPWWKVAYLIIPGDFARKYIHMDVDERFKKTFEDTVNKYVNAYLKEGAMPPAEIAPAILNMADDLAAGTKPTMRAGDYIAIQNFIRTG